MVREDIVAGLRIAVERGEPIEKAKQSFILAGYPRVEVEEAANLVHSGALLVINRGELPPLKIKEPSQESQEIPEASPSQPLRVKPDNFRKNFKIILLLVILLLLVGVLILTIVFREKIISLLS